jgi:hypothetical protein
VHQNKRVHAYRDWRNRLILFDEVDIYVPVERSADGRPSHAIIRAANRKSVKDIHQEIRQAQSETMPDTAAGRFMDLYATIPRFLRRSFFPVIYGVPRLFKKHMGTVMVTSVGMFGTGAGWGIGPVGHALTVTVGGIVLRPRAENGQLVNREHLCLTITFDHDVIDGAPAARFVQQFKRLVEDGGGLFEE